MATLTNTTEERTGFISKRFNWDYFLQDNITGSRGLTIWVAFLALLTLGVSIGQLASAPVRSIIIIAVWALAILAVVVDVLLDRYTVVSRWLKENMLNSVVNTIVTLLLSLLIGQLIGSLWQWGFVDATFSTATTAPELRSTGASWGVIWGARKLLMTGLLEPEHNWRVILSTVMVLVLWLLTFVSSRPSLKESLAPVARIMNYLWLLSPFAAYIFLAGLAYEPPFIDVGDLLTGIVVALAIMAVLWFFKVIQLNPVLIAAWALAWPIGYVVWRLIAQTGLFPVIDVDKLGGLLLTVIFAIFVNILTFPIGILLALGRRADVQGIPRWIVWPIAIVATVYFLATNSIELWETSRNNIERALSLWPILIVVATYYFYRSFNGNVVKSFSILSIELVRGVPLITLLFMAIVMSPFFSATGQGVKSFWAVIVGFTIFSSAYMAELVRGGLQAIPVGQYEAADSLGFNTLQKYRFIVLPQALRILIPPLAGSVIGTFKSSSLVALVGMIDLVGVTRAIIANPEWLGLRTELYAFMFVLYFVVSSVVSYYSRRLEERTGLGVR